MTFNASYDLQPALLPSTPYTLAYALPLFFVSVLLTFAGAFTTLDRTRTFAPSIPSPQSAEKSKRVCGGLTSFRWSTALGGGVGGLASGYAFGVHFSTFLALLIPNTTSSGPISHKAFIALWVLSAIPCTLLGGRWKYAAISLSGFTGYATLALSISVIIHPSLLTRIALTAVFAALGMVLCLLPFPRIARVSYRVACASTGAFGVVLTIALMGHVSAWSNVWERYWVQDGGDWGTSKEKGLSAAYCLLLASGLVCDWFLHLKFGENPDEKWDHYLSEYTTNLPNDRSRAGTFTPLVSFWDRLFGPHRGFAPVVPDAALPYDADLKLPLPNSPEVKLAKQRTFPSTDALPDLADKSRIGFLRKKGSIRVPGMKRTRRAIRFRPLDEEALSSSDDEEEDHPLRRSGSLRTDSSATLTNSRTNRNLGQEPELKPPQRSWETKAHDVPEYSDYEEDIVNTRRQEDRDAAGWTPEFIRRHSTRGSPAAAGRSPPVVAFAPPDNQHMSPTGSPSPSVPLNFPMASLPATPSLIRAVDRISAAQEALYRSQSPTTNVLSGLPHSEGMQHRDQTWHSFWTEVKAKASS